MKAIDEVCGWTRGPVRRRETWWWNDAVERAVNEKRRLYKEWREGGSRERYVEAKHGAKYEVYAAIKQA